MRRVWQSSGKIYSFIFASILAAALMAGCGKNQNEGQEIITQKQTDPGRTRVTVLVKYAFSINAFEEAVEEKFPNIDLVQIGNYSANMGVAAYENRLEHQDLPDMVMTWPLETGEEYWEESLLDLSGMEFTGRYNLSMLNGISRDGKLYYLPGPAQVRGIVYNKTLFEENGWKVPEDFEGFISLCKEIEAKGIRSLQLGFQNEEVLDTAFIGYNYSGSYSKPQDVQWLADYNNGQGSFGDHFGPALDTFQRMIDEGIWKPSDLQVDYSEREKMLFTRQCAMMEDSVLMARMGESQTGTTDQFALMPFFNSGDNSDWARLYMVCFIGLNKKLAEPENKEKYHLVMDLMNYISTPEGQDALSADTGAMFSSLTGTAPPSVEEIQALVPALQHGRYAVFPTLQNAQGALRKGLAGMIGGELTKDDVIRLVDAENQSPPVPEPSQKLGTASENFSMIETGSYITDVMREWADSDIALFMDNGKDGKYNGKGISACLYQGDVTEEDIESVLPDFKNGETGILWKISMTGENLLQTLEYSISVDNNVTGWFYYFSGLSMEFAPENEPGNRIQKITTKEGKPIDPKKIYTIAVMEDTVPQTYLETCEKTDLTVRELLKEAVETAGTIKPAGDGRFKVIN